MGLTREIMLAAFATSSLAFQSPATIARPAQAQRVATTMALDDMPGKYLLAGTVFDPLDLSSKYDVNWLREAEIKHGRLCMLAFLGWITVDAGITFPGEQFEGIKSLEAHDNLQTGACGLCFSWSLHASSGT